MDKVYLLVAGVNGAGKTSLYSICQDLRLGRRVNSDEICRNNGWDWRNPTDSFRAGKIAAKILDEAFRNGEPVCQETTLTGHGILNHIRKAKERGYRIEMHYVGLESVAIAKERVARRVSLGGHGIPDADIERRYVQSMANVREVAPIIDEMVLYDNSRDGAGLVQIAKYANGELLDEIKDLPAWYVAIKNDILQKSAALAPAKELVAWRKAVIRERIASDSLTDGVIDELLPKNEAKKDAPGTGKDETQGQGWSR